MNIHYLRRSSVDSDVFAGVRHPADKPTVEESRQLELDLEDQSCRVLRIAITGSIHGSTLATAIHELAPEFVLDLRDVLRFSMPGMSRDTFFHMLSSRGIHYARVPVGWHTVSPRAVTTGHVLPPRLYYEAVERWGKNLILLVSRAEHAVYTHAMLNMALSSTRATGWRIERIS